MSDDPVKDTRQIMAGTVTTTKVKQEYLSGLRDTYTAFKGALAAYKAVRAAEVPEPAPPPPPAPVEPAPAPIPTPEPPQFPPLEPVPATARKIFPTIGGQSAEWGKVYASFPAGSVLDARAAQFRVNNSKNPLPRSDYRCDQGTDTVQPSPIVIYSTPGVRLLLGRVLGTVPLLSDWQATYCNSAVVRIKDSPDARLEGGVVNACWDLFRSDNSDRWTVQGLHATDIRDDAFENDYMKNGRIIDCLIDGCNTFLSHAPHAGGLINGSANVVELNGALVRHKAFPHEGRVQHNTPFKVDSNQEQNLPLIRAINSVIAIEKVDHGGMSRQASAIKRMEGGNNFFLNLSDTPLPSTYPLLPDFAVLQGSAAREKWAAVKAGWLAVSR